MANANTSGAISRITREIASAQNNNDLSIAVACRDSDVRYVRALIVGPPETPYEFGFFEFDMKFPKDYPIKSPTVKCITTNNGRCRFNPNIYAEGKVCLSILGTWRGQPGEEWSSAQGLESVLLSIQSLMSPNPYENEPDYEGSKKDDPSPRAYIAKIRHETLRISVLKRLEALLQIKPEKSGSPRNGKSSKGKSKKWGSHKPAVYSPAVDDAYDSPPPSDDASIHEYDPDAALHAYELEQWDPFADLMKRRFLWYYDAYMRAIESFGGEQPDGASFELAEFEYGPNSMEGRFDYESLKRRMNVVRLKLDNESCGWLSSGATQVAEKSRLATQLAFEFSQMKQKWNDGQYSGSRMEVSLPTPENPFLWQICLFGEPMTNLDGGIFNMKMFIPPDFPNRQPRVTLETPIFHHRVSSNGTLCYFPKRDDEISSHLEAIAASIDDKNVNYDPRAMVNPDAFVLYWGCDDQRKVYSRKLRRSAQESRWALEIKLAWLKYELEYLRLVSRSTIGQPSPQPLRYPFEPIEVQRTNEAGEDQTVTLSFPDNYVWTSEMMDRFFTRGR